VPQEASGLRQPRFWIRVFLLLDRLPAKANEPCLKLQLCCHHWFLLSFDTTVYIQGLIILYIADMLVIAMLNTPKF